MAFRPQNGCFFGKRRVKNGPWFGFPDWQQLCWQPCVMLADMRQKAYARYVVTLVMLCVFGSFHLIPFLCFILFPHSVSLLATFI